VIQVAANGLGSFSDTIVARATPSGRGALAVIRLSGGEAFNIARRHVKSWPPAFRVAQLSTIVRNDHVLDQALVTLFPAPDSFTG
jgi:tRNA modification GTPase